MDALSAPSFLVEVLDHHGHALSRQRFEISGEGGQATVGRGIDADVIVDDAHVAARHVRIEVDAQGLVRLTDLGSVNGLVIGGKRRRGLVGEVLDDGVFQLGRTRLRVRTGAETLAPEKPEGGVHVDLISVSGRVAVVAATGFFLYGVYSAWVDAPRDVLSAVITAVAFSAAAAAAWITGWTLLARMLTGEWRWLRHAALFFGVAVAAGAAGSVLDLAWFALALPPWSSRDLLLGVVTFGALLFGHLSLASHLARRYAAIIATVLPLLIGGTALWVQSRGNAGNVNYIGMEEKIYPARLRLREGTPVADFFQQAAGLGEAAEVKRKNLPADDDGEEVMDFLD